MSLNTACNSGSLTLRLLEASFPYEWRRSGRVNEVFDVLAEDCARRGRGRPRFVDLTDVFFSGLLIRARCFLRQPLNSEVLAFALLGSGIGLASACLLLGEVPLPAYRALVTDHGYVAHTFGPFVTLGVVVYAGWLLLAIATLTRSTRLVRATAGLTLGLTVLLPTLAHATGINRPPLWLLLVFSLMNLGPLLGPAHVVRRAWVSTAVGGFIGLVLTACSGPGVFAGSSLVGQGTSGTDGRFSFYWDSDGLASLATRLPWFVVLTAAVFCVVRWRAFLSGVAVAAVAAPWLMLTAHQWATAHYSASTTSTSGLAPAVLLIAVLMLMSLRNRWLVRRDQVTTVSPLLEMLDVTTVTGRMTLRCRDPHRPGTPSRSPTGSRRTAGTGPRC